MYTIDKFEFTTEATSGADVTINESIHGKQQLLEWLAHALSFPDYFGENWDALIDCLSDFSWCNAPEVIIDHSGLPALPQKELRLYLESLVDALERRSLIRLPTLRVVFRCKDRERIADAFAK